MSALETRHYLRRRRPQHRMPAHSYSGLENVNTLIASPQPTDQSDTRAIDLRLNLATNAVGEGYVINYAPYREAVRKRKRHKKGPMSAEMFGGFVTQVAEQMAEDRFARSGKAVTICTFAKNSDERAGNLAVTGRLVHGTEFEVEELGKVTVAHKETPLTDLIPSSAVICELGRITVVEEYRGTWPDGMNQTTELVEFFIDGPNGVVETAQELGATKLITIAKNQFAKHTRGTQLDLGQPMGYKLSAKGLAIAEAYPGYWHDKDDQPMLYVASVPPKATT